MDETSETLNSSIPTEEANSAAEEASANVEDLFYVDNEPHELLTLAERHVPVPSKLKAAQGKDVSVAKKYQWRSQISHLCGDDNDETDSSDDDESHVIDKSTVKVNASARPRKLSAMSDDGAGLASQPRGGKKVVLDPEYFVLEQKISMLALDSSAMKMDVFGRVAGCVDALLMIKPNCGPVYLDVESIIFTVHPETKAPIPVGRIGDIIGRVDQPIYCILFNNPDELVNFPPGLTLYYAPDADGTVTKYLCIDRLREQQNHDDYFDSCSDDDDEALGIVSKAADPPKVNIQQRKRAFPSVPTPDVTQAPHLKPRLAKVNPQPRSAAARKPQSAAKGPAAPPSSPASRNSPIPVKTEPKSSLVSYDFSDDEI